MEMGTGVEESCAENKVAIHMGKMLEHFLFIYIAMQYVTNNVCFTSEDHSKYRIPVLFQNGLAHE